MANETQKYGRMLTPSEVKDAIVESGDTVCSACGTQWSKHREKCSGSYVVPERQCEKCGGKTKYIVGGNERGHAIECVYCGEVGFA